MGITATSRNWVSANSAVQLAGESHMLDQSEDHTQANAGGIPQITSC